MAERFSDGKHSNLNRQPAGRDHSSGRHEVMIETLTCSHFESHIGDVFTVTVGGSSLSLTLKAAKPLGTALREGGAFALNFAGPAAPLLQQSIYPLRHAALGTLELFVVPIGKDKDGIVYEAIFT